MSRLRVRRKLFLFGTALLALQLILIFNRLLGPTGSTEAVPTQADPTDSTTTPPTPPIATTLWSTHAHSTGTTVPQLDSRTQEPPHNPSSSGTLVLVQSGCHTLRDEQACVGSKDGRLDMDVRARIAGEACAWCCGSLCQQDRRKAFGNLCEPEGWLRENNYFSGRARSALSDTCAQPAKVGCSIGPPVSRRSDADTPTAELSQCAWVRCWTRGRRTRTTRRARSSSPSRRTGMCAATRRWRACLMEQRSPTESRFVRSPASPCNAQHAPHAIQHRIQDARCECAHAHARDGTCRVGASTFVC